MDTIKERVNKLLESDFAEYFVDSCLITEDSKEGKCKCKVILNEGIIFKKLDENCYKNITYKKLADYIILQKENDTWLAHIIEIKKTVNHSKWKKIKYQFRGAYLYSLLFSGILSIDIGEFKFHTVH